VLVLGETELIRALTTRGFGGFTSSLSAHLHLMPLDLDEARELLGITGRGDDQAERAFEALHRDARGNPRGILHLAQRRSDLLRPTSALDERPLSAQKIATAREGSGRAETASLVPAKPPLRVEEGLVEVGWDGDLGAELARTDSATNSPERILTDDSSLNEELIEDRYAALQAWTEWSKSQELLAGRSVATQASLPRGGPDQSPRSDVPPPEERPEFVEPSPAAAAPGFRAEPQHEFAPYSQLFTRLRQSNQP
jgi:general secretion pathway protein A